ncbi:MAG: transcription termination/antitermination protein NusA [Brevinema sp.]
MALSELIRAFASEHKIPEDIAANVLKDSFATLYKREFGKDFDNFEVELGKNSVSLWQIKTIVSEVEEPITEITAEDAKLFSQSDKMTVGDTIKIPLPIEKYGRQAALIIKQQIKQKVTDIQKDILYSEYVDKINTMFSGRVKSKTENKNGGYYISLEPRGTEAFLPYKEALPDEVLDLGDSVKVYLKDVLQVTKRSESQLILTRTNPAIVQELLKLHIPEIADGTFVIKAVARKPGEVTKILLQSTVDNLDPISVTVGKEGANIKPIRNELGSERIEIIRYKADIKDLITNAVRASRVLKNRIAEVFNIDLNYDTKEAFIVVADEFLAPLIGKGGSHQRMLEEIVGWKIIFRNYSEFEEVLKEKQKEVDNILGIGETDSFEVVDDEAIPLDLLPFTPEQINALQEAGFNSVTEVIELTVEDLTLQTGLSLNEALEIWKIIEDNIEIEEDSE